MMPLIVDGRILSSSYCGVGIYLYNVLKELARKASNMNIIVYTNKPINQIYNLLNTIPNIKIYVNNNLIWKNGLIWFLIKFQYIIFRSRPSLIWSPAVLLPFYIPKRHRTLITVHDVVFIEYPQTMSLKNRFVNKLLFRSSIKKASLLWTVSQYTKKQLLRYFPNIDKNNIFVGSSANTECFKKLDLSANKRKELKNTFFYSGTNKLLLFVGTLEPRKNLIFLLNLLLSHELKDYNLIIVGGKGWGNISIMDTARNLHIEDRIKILNNVSESELCLLYNTVDCYVSTSLNEGFGLPQLEAIICGCPVVSPNNSAMTEIVMNAGWLVDGWDIADWIQTITTACRDRDILNQNMSVQRNKYSWDKIIQSFIDFLATRGIN